MVSRLSQVYPRAYGGTGPDPHPYTYIDGLSPRVRGNPRTGEPARDEVYPRAYGGTSQTL